MRSLGPLGAWDIHVLALLVQAFRSERIVQPWAGHLGRFEDGERVLAAGMTQSYLSIGPRAW